MRVRLPLGALANSLAFMSFLVRMAVLTKLFPSASIAAKHDIGIFIARILGTGVSTQKDERLHGKKLLIVRPINFDGTDTTGNVVAIEPLGPGFHGRVL